MFMTISSQWKLVKWRQSQKYRQWNKNTKSNRTITCHEFIRTDPDKEDFDIFKTKIFRHITRLISWLKSMINVSEIIKIRV